MMESHVLKQRLNSLRSLVADCAESSRILKEVDNIIGICKQDQKGKDEHIMSLKAQCKSLRQKVKILKDQEQVLVHAKENLEADFEILTIKYENLQAKLHAINRNNSKEAKKTEKQASVQTKSYEIQVEIVSEKMVDDLSACYRREFEENQSLRRQIKEYEMQIKNENMSETFEEANDNETIFSEEVEDIFELPTRVGEQALDITKGAESSSLFDLIWTKSKQVAIYLTGK